MESFFSDESTLFSKDIMDFLRHNYFVMPNWKWIALAAAIVLGFILRPLIQLVLKKVKSHLYFVRHYPHGFSAYFLKQNVERPTAWIIVMMFWSMTSDAVNLTGNFEKYYGHVLRALIAFQIIRLLYYAVDAFGKVLGDVANQKNNKPNAAMNDQLIPFATKAIKIIVVVVGVLIVLQSSGINVMSLLAGLGIGGLALALAAQDTAANLFGSVTILSDQPFKIGDWIKVKDLEGNVEEIGFRSTRIRTFYNSLVTIPNSMMAKETIDNMGLRGSSRTMQELNLSYYTKPEMIEPFCQHLRDMLKQQQYVKKDGITVIFSGIKPASLTILVLFYVELPGLAQENQIKQEIFTNILKVANEMRVDFAIPLQMVPPAP